MALIYFFWSCFLVSLWPFLVYVFGGFLRGDFANSYSYISRNSSLSRAV